MWTLCRAEWIKTWKRPANWVLASIVLGIVLITFAGLTLVGLSDGEDSSMATSAQQMMKFPHGFQVPLVVLTFLGSIIGIVFMANSVGSEYSGDTWKALLPRRGKRADFIISKLASGFVFMVGLIVLAMLVGQALGLLGAAVVGGDLVSSESFSVLELLRPLTPVMLQVAVFAALTLLVTVVSRSTVLGIVFGVVGNATFGMAANLSSFAARILPNVHLSNLQAHWLPGEGAVKSELVAQVTQSFGMEISVACSALVIVGYIVGCVALAMFVFQRRDMAGQ
jgi:ABC-type transport system involved in multi-copper enzyme maturation permease subunit